MSIRLLVLISVLEVFLIILALEIYHLIRAYRVRRDIRKLFDDHMEAFFEEQDRRNEALEAQENEDE